MSRRHADRPAELAPAASGETGFLYVELLVAFGILAMILMSTIPIFIMSARVSAASNDLTLEANLARDKVESLQALGYSAISSGSDSFLVDSRRYLRSWVAETNVPYTGLKTVTITVQPSRHLDFGTPRVFTVSFVRAE